MARFDMSRLQLLVDDRPSPVNLAPGRAPRLRWRLLESAGLSGLGPDPSAGLRPSTVTAYQVVVAQDAQTAARGVGEVWDSGQVELDGSDGVVLSGLPSAASRRYWLALRLWLGGAAQPTDWSAPVTFGVGPGEQWSAAPIWLPTEVVRAGGDPEGGTSGNSRGWAFLAGEFHVPDSPVAWASLFASGASTAPARQFVFRAYLNGRFVGCGPTFPIAAEARYDGYDVTGLLAAGRVNRLGLLAYSVEDQWVACQLDIGLEDGRILHYGTDSSWKALPGSRAYPDSPSIGSQYYQAPAEDLVVAAYPRGFSQPGFDDADWPTAQVQAVAPAYEPNPAGPLRLINPQPQSLSFTDSGQLVIDFGVSWLGGIHLSADLPQPLALTVRFGETLRADGSVRYRLATSNTYEDNWQLTAGRQEVETWGLRVFRYVQLETITPAVDLRRLLRHNMLELTGAALVYPLTTTAAAFRSSDRLLNRVWELSRHTVVAFNGPIYVDSWTRERTPYEADAWIQQRAHLSLDYAPSLGRYSIDCLIANRTWPTEWPLYSVLAVHDAWMRTGDLRQAHNQYDALCALLPEQYIDEGTGLLVKEPGQPSQPDGDLVDWPPVERDGFVFGRVNTVVNALAAQAYSDMTDLAAALGREADAARLKARAQGLRQAINERLYDKQAGAYVDGLSAADELVGTPGPAGEVGPSQHHSLHAGIFALAFAAVPERRLPALAAFLRSRGMRCSVYAAAVYLDALYRAGLGADALTLLAASTGLRTWAHMLDQAAGATMEAWDPSLKPNTTYSHPWSASPVFLIPEGIFGIRPLEPAYRRFSVILQPGRLQSAALSLPVQAGDIRAAFQLGSGPGLGSRTGAGAMTGSSARSTVELSLRLEVPLGAVGQVVLPPWAEAREGCEWTGLTVDGQPTECQVTVAATRLGQVRCPAGSLWLGELGPGCHQIIATGLSGGCHQ